MFIGPISANQIKFIASLQQKKYRQKYNKFVVEGEKIVLELLKFHKPLCSYLIVAEDILADWSGLPDCSGVDVFSIKPALLGKISSLSTPPPVIALINVEGLPSRPLNDTILFLDGIKDPGNLGTMIRLADWFGMGAVACAPHSVETLNPKVIQASMGSIFRMPVLQIDLVDLKQAHPNLPVITMDMEGSPIHTASFPKEAIFVIGSESHGISPEVAAISDIQLFIPRYSGQELPESLNAANAAAILAYQIRSR